MAHPSILSGLVRNVACYFFLKRNIVLLLAWHDLGLVARCALSRTPGTRHGDGMARPGAARGRHGTTRHDKFLNDPMAIYSQCTCF